MATQLLAVNTTAASSSDIVIADGESVTVCLKGFTTHSRVNISLKDDGGAYVDVGVLQAGAPALVISGPGTYRVTRVAGAACGVFSG